MPADAARALTEEDYVRAHDLSLRNEGMVRDAELCGCFHCLATFDPSEVTEWLDDDGGRTALCPRCGIDSVICSGHGYPLTGEFLAGMRRAWFG